MHELVELSSRHRPPRARHALAALLTFGGSASALGAGFWGYLSDKCAFFVSDSPDVALAASFASRTAPRSHCGTGGVTHPLRGPPQVDVLFPTLLPLPYHIHLPFSLALPFSLPFSLPSLPFSLPFALPFGLPFGLSLGAGKKSRAAVEADLVVSPGRTIRPRLCLDISMPRGPDWRCNI